MKAFAKTLLKSLFATGVATVPVAIKQFAPAHWTGNLFVAYFLAVFAASLKVFEPDKRFLAVREPTIKAYFKAALREAPPDAIRANIYVARGIWPCRCLVPLISYNANPAHADYGKKWPRGRGLCWKVHETGKFGLCRKGIHSPEIFGLKAKDISVTEHVEAVFCLPLRRKPKNSSDDGVSGRVSGVLAYDALSADGANFLEAEHDRLVRNENKELLDLVEAVSLYF